MMIRDMAKRQLQKGSREPGREPGSDVNGGVSVVLSEKMIYE